MMDASNLPSMIDKYGFDGAQIYYSTRYVEGKTNLESLKAARAWKKAM